ncbi:hypothetical protein JHK85_020543 [Glycine max]|nr:hypothetical protein JHK85_020543 [Glycine max]
MAMASTATSISSLNTATGFPLPRSSFFTPLSRVHGEPLSLQCLSGRMEHNNSNLAKMKTTILRHIYMRTSDRNLTMTIYVALFRICFHSLLSMGSEVSLPTQRELAEAGKDIESAYWELVVKDIQDACKLLEPIYNEKDGEDGNVSVMVSPKLANDTKGTIEAAKKLHKMVGSPSVYIKIPATDEFISSMKEVICLGISVYATLIFCLPKYEAVIDAYLDGLEACSLTDLYKVSSAAAFYISRVDATLDKKLDQIGTTEALDLKGKGAVAQAVLAYQLYQKKFSGPRWER